MSSLLIEDAATNSNHHSMSITHDFGPAHLLAMVWPEFKRRSVSRFLLLIAMSFPFDPQIPYQAHPEFSMQTGPQTSQHALPPIQAASTMYSAAPSSSHQTEDYSVGWGEEEEGEHVHPFSIYTPAVEFVKQEFDFNRALENQDFNFGNPGPPSVPPTHSRDPGPSFTQQGPPRFAEQGPPRFAEQGPPRFAEQGPPRFAEQGPPRFAEHGPPHFAEQGPPRFAEHGPPRFAEQGPPRFAKQGPAAFIEPGPSQPSDFTSHSQPSLPTNTPSMQPAPASQESRLQQQYDERVSRLIFALNMATHILDLPSSTWGIGQCRT